MALPNPHITVACVVEQAGKYLLVEERDKRTGQMVFNQPAGHVEAGEGLFDAALREVREETGWQVSLQGVISVSLYQAPANGHHYLRTTFQAVAETLLENAHIDPDIECVHWLDYQEVLAISARMRSPLVLASIEAQRSGQLHPLDVIYQA